MYQFISPVEKSLYESIADSILKERKEVELKKRFSSRSIQICNSALCNGIIGSLDQEIAEIDIIVIENMPVERITSITTCEDFQLKNGYYEGRRILIKQVSKSSILNKNVALVLGNELKILSFLGKHPNIVNPLALTEMDNSPAALYDISVYSNLKECFQNQYTKQHLTISQVIWIIRHLTSALEYLFIKGILHNNIIEESIFMQQCDIEYGVVPVLAEFSCACPATKAGYLTAYFQERFAVTKHLPPDVLNGKVLPSFKSDIFSFGKLVSNMANHLGDQTPPKERLCLERIVHSLFANTSGKLPDKLFSFFM